MELLENNWGKVRCRTCDSVMRIEKEDIHFSIDDGHYTICPVCGSHIWFNDEDEDHPVVKGILSGCPVHK